MMKKAWRKEESGWETKDKKFKERGTEEGKEDTETVKGRRRYNEEVEQDGGWMKEDEEEELMKTKDTFLEKKFRRRWKDERVKEGWGIL